MKRGTELNVKFKRLQSALGLDLWETKGLLQALWDFAAESSLRGDIGRYSDADLALGIGWKRTEPDALVAALVECGWLDEDPEHRLLIHDWPDHCEDWIRKRLVRAGLMFANGADPAAAKGRQRQPPAATGSLPGPSHNQSHNQKKEPAPTGARPARVAVPPEFIELAEHLRDRIHELAPTARSPTASQLASWGRTLHLMHRIDGRSHADIRAVIDWVFGPVNQSQEARFVVHSAKALREKYDRIVERAKVLREQSNGANQTGVDRPSGRSQTPLADATRRRAERRLARRT